MLSSIAPIFLLYVLIKLISFALSSEFCATRFIRGEPIFVDYVGQPYNEFMNPTKYISISNYATTLIIT
jgi:hypothetical protein